MVNGFLLAGLAKPSINQTKQANKNTFGKSLVLPSILDNIGRLLNLHTHNAFHFKWLLDVIHTQINKLS